MKVPSLNLKRLHDSIKPDLDRALVDLFESQQFILGKHVKEFEERMRSYLQVSYAVGVASGTDALLLALRALAYTSTGKEYFDPGDEIITTPFTFVATADTILLSGGTPVFVDIDRETLNLSPAAIRAYLEREGAGKVKAILVVHLYGQAADMGAIMQVAADYKVPVIEDAAQVFGGEWEGKRLGSIGLAGCFSFYPSKPLGALGDAGMVATSDREFAEMVRMLRTHGGKDKYNVSFLGYNSRIDALQAVLLLAKLPYVGQWIEGRREVARIYSKELKGVGDIVLPDAHGRDHVWHQYVIRTARRDALKEFLATKSIDSTIYYPVPLHQQALFKDRVKMFGALTVAEEAARTVLSLPIDPLQTEEETSYVVSAIKEFFRA